MLTVQEWETDIQINIRTDTKFKKLEDNKGLFEVLDFLKDSGVMVGNSMPYYYWTNGGEVRENIYFKNIGLFKINIIVNYSDCSHCSIKIEKIRKSENNVDRLQDINKKLENNVMEIFDKSYYIYSQNDLSDFNLFKKRVNEILHSINEYEKRKRNIKDIDLTIQKITISNFKKIDKATIELNSKLKILVGMNNAGKTSFIQGILVGYQALTLLEKENKIKYDIFGQMTKAGQGVRLDKVPFLLNELIDLFNYNSRKNMSSGLSICKFDFGNNIFIEIGARLVGEIYSVYIFNCSPGITQKSIKKFIENPITLIPSFFNVVTNEERKSPARYNSLLKSGNYNQLFRNILLDLKNKDEEDNLDVEKQIGNCEDKPLKRYSRFGELQRLVEQIFQIKNLDVEFEPEEDEFIIATYEVENIGRTEKIDISTLGMGTLQFIQVIAQVLLGKPSIILLDEPDAHLHAKLQVEIIRQFQLFAEKYKTSFIIATHSKDIINAINPKDILVLDNKNGLVPAENYENGFIGAIKNLGATTEELIGLNLGKRIIIVEGVDDKEYIQHLCQVCGIENSCKNYNLVNILPLGGRKNVISNQWDKFINIEDDTFKKIAVFDRDYRPLAIQQKDATRLKKKGFEVVEWSKKEFENYLLNPEIIAEVINESYPQVNQINEAKVKEKINDVYEQTRDAIQFEYEKYIELEKKQQIEKVTKEKFNNITLNKNDQLAIRKEAENYVSNQNPSDIICGKDAFNKIRTELITKNTPTKDNLAKAVIEKLVEKNLLHEDINNLLKKIKEISE